MRSFILFLSIITILSTSALAVGLPGSSLPQPILSLDKIVVQLDESANLTPVRTYIKMAEFGLNELDSVCQGEGVSYITPQHPGVDPNGVVDLSRYYIVHFEESKADANELFATIRAFEASPYVESVEHDELHFVSLVPNDTLYYTQWGLSGEWGVRAEGAWDINTGNSDVIVAIADTGVDYIHPDLENNIWLNDDPIGGGDDDGNGYVDDWCGWDFVASASSPWPGEDGSGADNEPMDFNGHGTHCSGIASAETNNSEGVASLGYSVSIMCLRVGWSTNYGGVEYGVVGMSYAASAMTYAANEGAVSFNASWGSSNSGGLSAAATYAANNGCQVITAAGNGNPGGDYPPYLGTRSDVIAVAATTSNGKKAGFSNYGTWVDVSAPGLSIRSTVRIHYGAHEYVSWNGTSMAAPFVTGLCGLVKSEFPGYSRQDIRDAIEGHCRPLNNDSYYDQGKMGEGLIDAEETLDYGTGVDDEGNSPNAPFAFTVGSSYPNPTSAKATISFALPDGYAGAVKLELFDIAGRKVATPLDDSLNAGEHNVDISTSNLANGVYLYKLTAGEDTAVKKRVVNR